MPRPSVESVRVNITLSKGQINQVDKIGEALALSTTSETLRYLITRGIQTEIHAVTATGHQQMSRDFSEFVAMCKKEGAL